MTQSPETVVQSLIRPIITPNLATTIAFPNPEATRDVYIDGLGFSEAEYQTIKETSPDSRLFLYRQQRNQAILCRLDLGALADEIRVLSSSKASVKILDKVMAELGSNEHVWLPEFLKRSAA